MHASAPADDWESAESAPALTAGEVHVWRARLEVAAEVRDRLGAALDPEEHDRASRFRFDRDRDRYIVRHGVLRALLARYLETSPSAVRFARLQHGKPVLAGAEASRGVAFSMSHSGTLALFGFTLGGELGVDVERIDPERADPDVARRFFAPGEVAALAKLDGYDRVRGFFDCWTRKEAFVKAIGQS